MGIVPNYPGQIGVLTSDYIDTYFDAVLAVSSIKTAVSHLSENYDDLYAVYSSSADIVAAAEELNTNMPTMEAMQDNVAAIHAAAEVIENTILAAEASAIAAKDLAQAAQLSATTDAIDTAADLALIQSIIDDTGINTISLHLGDRLDSTATLTYGSRV